MTKKQAIWCVCFSVVLPSILYFLINGYWWLFDGNVLNSQKMGTSAGVSALGVLLLAAWADVGEIWK